MNTSATWKVSSSRIYSNHSERFSTLRKFTSLRDKPGELLRVSGNSPRSQSTCRGHEPNMFLRTNADVMFRETELPRGHATTNGHARRAFRASVGATLLTCAAILGKTRNNDFRRNI